MVRTTPIYHASTSGERTFSMWKDGHAAKRASDFAYKVICACGALACVFVWLDIKPKDLWGWRVTLSLPHWLWLLAALVLFALSIFSSIRSFRVRTTTGGDASQADAVKIKKLSDQIDWNGGNTAFPLTLRMQCRNDSGKALGVELKEYRKNRVALAAKGFPPQALQLRFGGAWLPPGYTNKIAVLPEQQFQAFIGLDETSLGKADVEGHRGKIGTLIFIADGHEVPIDL